MKKAQFGLEFVDSASAPARKAAGALRELAGAQEQVNKSSKSSRGGAGGKSDKAARDDERAAAKAARDQERAAAKEARDKEKATAASARESVRTAKEQERAAKSQERAARSSAKEQERKASKEQKISEKAASSRAKALQSMRREEDRYWSKVDKDQKAAAKATAREAAKAAKETARATAKAEKQAAREAKAAEGKGWKDIVKGELVMKGIDKITDVASEAARAGFEMMKFGERSRLAFGQLAQHAGADPSKLFKKTRQMSKDFGLDLEDTTDKFKELLMLQFSPKQAENIIKMSSDLRGFGVEEEKISSVISTMGQIKSKGKLQGEEMLQLQEAGISGELVKKAIAKRMGVDYSQVDKLQSAGKVSSDVAIASIQDAIIAKTGEKNLGDTGKNFANSTIEGKLNRMKALFQDFGLTLADRVSPAVNRALEKITTKLNDFFNSDKGQAFVDKIGGFLETVSDKLADWIALLVDNQGAAMYAAGQTMGKNAGAGFQDGMKSSLPGVSAASILGADTAVKSFSGPKGIDARSPSRKFAKRGKWAAEGFAQGLTKEMDGVGAEQGASAVATFGAATSSAAVTAAVGGGPASVSFAPVINVPTMQGADPQVVANAVQKAVRREFEACLAAVVAPAGGFA